MTDDSSGSKPFSIAVIVGFEPIAVISTLWFFLRRDVQPIKARQPLLVIITDIIFMLYILIVCLQRAGLNDYPCWLFLWAEYVGSIMIGNAYVWRCWNLYFSFNLTQHKLNNTDMSTLPEYFRSRYYVSNEFFAKISFFTILVLISPCIAATVTESASSQTTATTVNCPFSWAKIVIGVITVMYASLLLFFAYHLKSVADGFQIKTELKLSGAITFSALVPWVIFNQKAYSNIGNGFPWSTLALVCALIGLLCTSTIYPLFRSLYKPPKIISDDLPESLDMLAPLISTKEGFDSFRKFLTNEFSVENLLFFADIEDLRKKVREGSGIDFVKIESKRLHSKYVVVDSPFQVNLADQIVQGIDEKLDVLQRENRIEVPRKPDDDIITGKPIDCPTIFDEAQRSIFNLMDTDSFPRYKAHEIYRDYVNSVKQQQHKNSVLREMDII